MKRVFATLLVIVLLGLGAVGLKWGYDQVFIDAQTWYAQVDGACMTKADRNNNDFDYHYELSAASETGATQTLGFDTSRELRDGAYLKLETLALRGVVSWEEVAWDDIPAAAREAL